LKNNNFLQQTVKSYQFQIGIGLVQFGMGLWFSQ